MTISRPFRPLTLSLFFIVLFSTALRAQTKTEQIDAFLRLYNQYGLFNGSVLVAENGVPIYKSGFGMANFEWEIANVPNTKHRIGSITKQFTAALILQMVEKGRLKLDVPITAYIPDYPKASGDRVTIHHLLTHTSGIPSYTDFPNFFEQVSRDNYSPAEFLKIFWDKPLEFSPGEKFSYSNSGYFLLGYIIEKVSGKSYESCLRDQILTPVKMNDTGYDFSETILKNRAGGYESDGDKMRNADFLDMGQPFSAGAMYSTVEDLYLWDRALSTDGVLSAKSRELMFAKYVEVDGSHYGYGWFLDEIPGVKDGGVLHVTEHGGSINGFSSIFSRIPADKNLIVLLNNTGNAPLGAINRGIRAILYGKPYKLPKKSLARTLLATISEKGLAAGVMQFKELKNSEVYSISEREINAAGYTLMKNGKIPEAVEMFKINVASFPKSANAHDSLGEAYLKQGNKKLAIANYKKAVELDPENQAFKKALEEISKK